MVRSLWTPHNFSKPTYYRLVIDSVTIHTCCHIQQGERGIPGDPGNPGVKGEKVRIKILLTFVTHFLEFSSGAFVANSSHPKP